MFHACATGNPIPFLNEPVFLDWGYFFHRNAIADSSCLLVRQCLSHCMRNDVTMTGLNQRMAEGDGCSRPG